MHSLIQMRAVLLVFAFCAHGLADPLAQCGPSAVCDGDSSSLLQVKQAKAKNGVHRKNAAPVQAPESEVEPDPVLPDSEDAIDHVGYADWRRKLRRKKILGKGQGKGKGDRKCAGNTTSAPQDPTPDPRVQAMVQAAIPMCTQKAMILNAKAERYRGALMMMASQHSFLEVTSVIEELASSQGGVEDPEPSLSQAQAYCVGMEAQLSAMFGKVATALQQLAAKAKASTTTPPQAQDDVAILLSRAADAMHETPLDDGTISGDNDDDDNDDPAISDGNDGGRDETNSTLSSTGNSYEYYGDCDRHRDHDSDEESECSSSKSWDDCRETECCSDPGMQCYQKNRWWASCRANCTPGMIDPQDPFKYRTPWSCRLLGSNTPKATPKPKEEKQFIQFDGLTKTPVATKTSRGFSKEMLIRFPLSDGIALSGDRKSVHIPLTTMFEAEYARDSYTLARKDYGKEKIMMFQSNNFSMISDRVKLAFMEKAHTLWYSGEYADMPQASKEKFEASRRNPLTPLNDIFASQPHVRWLKSLFTSAFVKDFGKQVIAAGQDVKLIAAVREYVKAWYLEAQSTTELDWRHIRSYNRILKQRSQEVQREKVVDTLRSSVSCIHLETVDGMIFHKDYVEIPLERRVVAYRGRLAMAPNQEYNFATGYGVFYYNSKTNSLDFWVGYSAVVDIIDAHPSITANFHVSSINGGMDVAPHGSRIPRSAMHPMQAQMLKAANAIPTDYAFLYKHRTEAGCPESALKRLETDSEEILRMLQSKGNPATLLHFVDAAPCGVEFLRPDHYHMAGYGQFEAMGMIHFLAEIPPESVIKVLATPIRWNSIDGKELY